MGKNRKKNEPQSEIVVTNFNQKEVLANYHMCLSVLRGKDDALRARDAAIKQLQSDLGLLEGFLKHKNVPPEEFHKWVAEEVEKEQKKIEEKAKAEAETPKEPPAQAPPPPPSEATLEAANHM